MRPCHQCDCKGPDSRWRGPRLRRRILGRRWQSAKSRGRCRDSGHGGFKGDEERLLLEKIRPDLMHLPTTNGDHSQGDGITIALDIGAKAMASSMCRSTPQGS